MRQENIQGIVENYGAALMDDGKTPKVTVWDADGNVIFDLPANSTADHVNCAIGIHEDSYRMGIQFGANEARRELSASPAK